MCGFSLRVNANLFWCNQAIPWHISLTCKTVSLVLRKRWYVGHKIHLPSNFSLNLGVMNTLLWDTKICGKLYCYHFTFTQFLKQFENHDVGILKTSILHMCEAVFSYILVYYVIKSLIEAIWFCHGLPRPIYTHA